MSRLPETDACQRGASLGGGGRLGNTVGKRHQHAARWQLGDGALTFFLERKVSLCAHAEAVERLAGLANRPSDARREIAQTHRVLE